MTKFIFFILVSVFFIGCHGVSDVKPDEKAFEGEDRYVMFALEAEKLGDYNSSASLFNTVYKASGKKEYLYRSLLGLLNSNQYETLLERSIEHQKDFPDDSSLKRYEILALVDLDRLEDAKNRAIELVNTTKEPDDYILVSNIYIKQNHFKTALKYLESAYNVNYNEKILDKMAIILYVNLQRKSEALAYLESHIRIHGCSKLICLRLAGFYSNENNVEGMLTTYLRLYEIEPSDEVAQNIIKLYGYQKDYSKLMFFLEECNCDNDLLLQLYVEGKLYDKASDLAKKLYAQNYDPQYLAQSAIYKYESLDKKKDKKSIIKILKDLKDAVDLDPRAQYLNYLGYLMIEHNLNVKEGMDYVREALKEEPNSAYYLDSLAWGYYKLHQCTKAKTIMDQVVKDIGLKDVEAKEHFDAIDKCIKAIKHKKVKKHKKVVKKKVKGKKSK
ncbi:hypothetical protein KKA17_11660 [bacterium]|nr:hypothetical protein [bacterium]MBU1883668.1 hypothetical protein [bacterium]